MRKWLRGNFNRLTVLIGSLILIVSEESKSMEAPPNLGRINSVSDRDDFLPSEEATSRPSRVKQIWAIGGGKGGIGKSLIASNLAIALSRLGNAVTAIDFDLGGANLHTTLGVDLPRKTLSDFIAGRVESLKDCSVPSGLPKLELISGAQDSVKIAEISAGQRKSLVNSLRSLDSDYVILDLGAGTADYTLDFFLAADIGLITILPEPTSIENSYRFIKAAYYRRLLKNPKLEDIRSIIEVAMDQQNSMGIRSPSDLFKEVNRTNPEAAMRLKREIEKFQPKLIVNQARTQNDVDIGNSVKAVCKKYFGIDLDYLGHLDYDSAVWQSVRRKRPLLLEFPNSRLVSSLDQIARSILKRYG